MRIFLTVCVLCCMALGLKAQENSQRQWLGNPHARLAVQPDALADSGFAKVSLHGNAAVRLAGTAGLLDLYLQNDGFLDDEEKRNITGRLGTDNAFQYADQIGPFMLTFRLGNIPLSIQADRSRSYGVSFSNVESLELLLNGNAGFAGQTVRDEAVTYHRLQLDRLGIGTAARIGKATLGVRAFYASGRNMVALDRLNFGLFTAEDGTQLSLDADYLAHESTSTGWGLGMDLGFTVPMGNYTVRGAAFDIGFMNWDALKQEARVSLDYRGVNLTDLVEGSLPRINLGDTLRRTAFPDSVNTEFSHLLPARGNLSLEYRLKPGQLVFIKLSHAAGPFAPGGGKPIASLGYQRHWNAFSLGGQAFVGGLEGWGLGGIAACHLKGKKGSLLDFVVEVNNVMGIITSSNGGFRGQAGLVVGLH